MDNCLKIVPKIETAHLELSFIPEVQWSNHCGSYLFKVWEQVEDNTPPIPLIIRFTW